MVALKYVKIDDRGNLSIVASAIQKIKPTDQTIEEGEELNHGKGKANTTKRAKSIQVEENKNEASELQSNEVKRKPRKRQTIKPNQAKKKQKDVSDLQPNEVQGKRKRRLTKKKFEDYIQLSSDDDQTLTNLFSQVKNKKTKSSPPIKVKKEKI